MSYQESLDYLYGLQKFGIKLGLENIRTFLSRLGHPECRFKSVLVAGTNGKGSTATAMAAMLGKGGYRVGLYTSPHLHSFCERVRVDGVAITEARMVGLVERMREHAAGLPLTFFEFTTALALLCFAESGVDIAILEVGMGGRLDATNAVTPILSVITPVDRDHEQYLGDDLATIAGEKAGIMRSGVPVVSARQHPEVDEALAAAAARIGTAVIAPPSGYSCGEVEGGFDFVAGDEHIRGLAIGVAGRHQCGNMATAVAAVNTLTKAGFPISEVAMRNGLIAMCWPGRLEWLCEHRLLLDGAHNGAAARVLADYLADEHLENVHWIVGLKADKNIEAVLGPILPHAAAVYCVEPPVEEAAPLADIAALAARHGVATSQPGTITAALSAAREAAAADGTVLVAGSLFLVAAVRELIFAEEGRPCDSSVY